MRIGLVGIGPDHQPRIERVTQVRRGLLPFCVDKGFTLSPPDGPWRMEISIRPTFVPQELDPEQFSDRRHLGAKLVAARFVPLFGG